MLKSTLLLTLRLLSREERDLLELFIQSPIFKLGNRHQDAVDLHNYLKPFTPLYEDSLRLERKLVAEQLFRHRANPENELRKAMSNLQSILKKLILFQQISTSGKQGDKAAGSPEETIFNAQTELAMMHFFSERTIAMSEKGTPLPQLRKEKPESDIVEQLHTGIKNKVNHFKNNEGSGLPLNHYHFSQYRHLLFINVLADYELLDYHSLVKTAKYQVNSLMVTADSLDCLYYHLKLDIAINLLIQMKIGNPFQDDDNASAFVIAYFKQTELTLRLMDEQINTYPVLELYKNAFLMLYHLGSEESLQAYEHLSFLFSKGVSAANTETIKNLKASLRIFCTLMFHQTQSLHFLQKKFDLTREHINEEMLLHGESIPAIQFTSLIRDALRLGKENHTWVEQFLQKFENGRNLMATETPREVFRINKANFFFHSGQFREASNELIAYEWYGHVDDVQILLLAIRIDIKIQYELNRLDDDYSLRMMDAAEKRLKRLTELNDSLKNMTLNFMRLTRQLYLAIRRNDLSGKKIMRNFDFQAKVAELDHLLNTTPVAEKEWLLEKISAFRPL